MPTWAVTRPPSSTTHAIQIYSCAFSGVTSSSSHGGTSRSATSSPSITSCHLIPTRNRAAAAAGHAGERSIERRRDGRDWSGGALGCGDRRAEERDARLGNVAAARVDRDGVARTVEVEGRDRPAQGSRELVCVADRYE